METQPRTGLERLAQPDACPFPRPFPPGFAECGAYQPVAFVPLDTGHHPLRSVRTCQHLELGTAGPGAFYARCGIGTGADRERWLESQRVERAARIQALGERSLVRTRPQLEAMWAAKAEQLRLRGPGVDADVDLRVREAAARFLEVQLAFLEDEANELEALGFPLPTLTAVTTAAVDDFVARSTAEWDWQPDPAHLEAVPPRNRAYLAGLFKHPPAGFRRP